MPPVQRSTRSTTFDLYSDTGCNDYLSSVNIIWDDNQHDRVFSLDMGSDRYWQSSRWTGNDHNSESLQCQFGNSGWNVRMSKIFQDPHTCSSGGGDRYDKILVS
jgi:hypothetical protein